MNFIIERQNTVTACIKNLRGTDGSLNWFSLIASWLARRAYVPIWNGILLCLTFYRSRAGVATPLARPAFICYAMCCIMWRIITRPTLICLPHVCCLSMMFLKPDQPFNPNNQIRWLPFPTQRNSQGGFQRVEHTSLPLHACVLK